MRRKEREKQREGQDLETTIKVCLLASHVQGGRKEGEGRSKLRGGKRTKRKEKKQQGNGRAEDEAEEGESVQLS